MLTVLISVNSSSKKAPFFKGVKKMYGYYTNRLNESRKLYLIHSYS